jgi:hypothetical protein
LIFDQIHANKGTLKYCIRWESDETVTAAQRDKIATLASRVINNWNAQLAGYDNWPYGTITVKVTGWAVKNRATLAWSDTSVPIYVGDLDDGGAPQCASGTFNMSLWGTKGWTGGAGGDWGQRVGSTYILNSLDLDEPHIIEHEIGHGFNLPDFYDANQFPPTGLPLTIMQAGASSRITAWDKWMIRRVWSELLRAKPSRFGR